MGIPVLSYFKHKSTSASYWIDLFWLSLFLFIFYSIWIGSHPLFTPDEGRYSEVAREMAVTHDYITPRLNGVVFLDKPILYYWLQAMSIHLFGLKEATLRLWPCFIGMMGCLFVYLGGRILFNRRAGLLSAVILASSPLFYGAAHYANLDLEVAVFVSMSLLSFLIAAQTTPGKRRTIFFLTAYIFSALASLTKGLIGIAFPIMIAGLWIILQNRWSLLKQAYLLTGFLIYCLITLPWYFLAQHANPQFFHYFFVIQHFSRFLTTDSFNNRTGLWFYIPVIVAGFFPWTLFLAQALWKKVNAAELFLVIWAIVVFVFFSIPHSKTVGYILPIFPSLALLTGKFISDHWETFHGIFNKISMTIYILITLMFIEISLNPPHLKHLDISPDLKQYVLIAGGLFLSITIALIISFKKPIRNIFTLFFISAIFSSLVISASSTTLNEKTTKPLATLLKPILQPSDEVVTYYKYYQDLPIYLERRITIVADWQADDIRTHDNWVRELWFGMPYQDTHEWLINESTFWKKWNSQKRLYVFLNQSYIHGFEQNVKSPIYKLGQFNEIVLISNQPTT